MLEFFSEKGEIILEFHSTNQNTQQSESNDPSVSFICFFCGNTRANFKDVNHLSLLNQLQAIKLIIEDYKD